MTRTFERIPALTLWQPWASLIIAGVEPHVIPNWPSPHIHAGAKVAIHASARPARKSEIPALYLKHRAAPAPIGTFGSKEKVLTLLEAMREAPLSLPLAAILGTVILGEPDQAKDTLASAAFGEGIQALLAFPVSETVTFSPPIPAKGKQGFWMWDIKEFA